ncbi:H(+)-transporting V0 sector ATPase subunit a [Massospora cicadina]|nr:H(+)-transporting V0 sector ATPase subunit a [Massospora cicadina]
MFRSERMSYIQIYIPFEIARLTVAQLGTVGLVEFIDVTDPETHVLLSGGWAVGKDGYYQLSLDRMLRGLIPFTEYVELLGFLIGMKTVTGWVGLERVMSDNGLAALDLLGSGAFQRAFVGELRRLDEIDRKLRYFGDQLRAASVAATPLSESRLHLQIRSAQDIIELETTINHYEARLSEMLASHAKLQRRHVEAVELRQVLVTSAPFFMTPNLPELGDDATAPLLGPVDVEAQFEMREIYPAGLNSIAGVIPRARAAALERILWRSLHGNFVLKFAEADAPTLGPGSRASPAKHVFVIFAYGAHVIHKIRKVAESLGATLYPVSEHADLRMQSLSIAENQIYDLGVALDNTASAIRAELAHIAQNLTVWATAVKREKAIYHTLNHFNYDHHRRCLIAEGWCATTDLGCVQDALTLCGEHEVSLAPILHTVPTHRQPPTFHRTNKFTEGFQAIVDSYGVSNYGEVNPGLFTIISFPFLFAVMFGDLGHAIIMTSAALYMVLNERSLAKVKSEEFSMFYGGRYIILLMGLFSIFTGLIYNDIFSRSMTLFKSGWRWPALDAPNQLVSATPVGVYPFGLDPAWHGTDNVLIFTNSYKMKMSVIFGVVQMCFGVVLSTFNYRHFNEHYSIYLEFIPQILFMLCIFGYLCFTILYKWVVDWTLRSNPPPSLLNMLIDMFLSPGTVLEQNKLFPGQAVLQLVLLLVALAAVPVMLLGKPMYLRHLHQQREAQAYSTLPIHTQSQDESHEMSHEEEFDFGELMIHQTIHTIEYCLNCISNTASYLRLWALSLAHAQLSAVLWEMVLVPSLRVAGVFRFVAVLVGGAAWLLLTVLILILMEGLSAFLHALRLHWVEFNGKFYGGKGQRFTPSTLRPS